MIKFFRRIRQQLLSENKFSKYLFYAIGEIILVVIGILIALQINNRNENRIAQKAKTQYCKQLLNELEVEIESIDMSLKRLEVEMNSYTTYEAIYETPNLSVDTIYASIKKVSRFVGVTHFNTKTIDVLTSTGDIKLFPNTIKNLLVTLETQQERLKNANDVNYGAYLDATMDTYLINFLSIESKLTNQKTLAKALDFNHKLPEQIAKQHQAITLKQFGHNVNSIELNEILKTVNELKQLVEKELEQ